MSAVSEVLELLTDEELIALHSAGASIHTRLFDPEDPESKTTATLNELESFLRAHPVLIPNRNELFHHLAVEYANVFEPDNPIRP